MTSLGSLLLAAAAATASLHEPHAAAAVFDESYPTLAACQIELQHARREGTARFRRLYAHAMCHPVPEPGGVRFHVRMVWKRTAIRRWR